MRLVFLRLDQKKDRVFHWNAELTLVMYLFFPALGTKPSGLGMRLPQHINYTHPHSIKSSF